ncbi:hypothetical protein BG004_008351, partial [Podila humilis]
IMQFALDIPELREKVSARLSAKDQVACLQVSRLWHDAFTEDIWRCTTIGSVHARNPPLSALTKNAQLIRELRYSGLLSIDYLTPGCTNLRALAIDGDMVAGADKHDKVALEELVNNISSRVTVLIESNPRLDRFEYSGQQLKPSSSIWRVLEQRPIITSLRITRCTMRLEDLPSFWAACTKVETLELLDSNFTTATDHDNRESIPPLVFSKLQSLWMVNMKEWPVSHQLQFVSQAPHLKTWQWRHGGHYYFPSTEFRKLMQSKCCPQLSRLDLCGSDVADDDLVSSLETMPSVVAFQAQGTGFGRHSLASLFEHKHCATLRTLDLYRCNQVTSPMVQLLLSKCPLLKTFSADVLRGIDIINGEPWACVGLEILTLIFDLDGTIPEESQTMSKEQAREEEQHRTCEQLSKLESLQHLNMFYRQSVESSNQSLAFRLRKNGGILEDLECMKRLQYLNFHGTEQRVEVEDLDWMFEHWPSLKFVLGQFHQVKSTQDKVMAAMMSKGADQAPPSYSSLIAPHEQSTRICCITLNEADKIRLIGCPPDITNGIRLAIRQGWGAIQRESDYSGAHEFKIMGNPWYGQGEESVQSRKLITSVLRVMANYGWNLIQAADVSKKQTDKDSLFFELGQFQDPQADLFAISFNRSDRIRVIDAPHVVPWVKQAIQTQWRQGIQKEQTYATAHEFKLSGNPFYSDGSSAVFARMLLAQILANLRAQGYKLYTSVDISIGSDGMDVESWVFRRVSPAWS